MNISELIWNEYSKGDGFSLAVWYDVGSFEIVSRC